MNILSLPGFGAEASLHRPRQHYYAVTARGREGVVQQQQFAAFPGFRHCWPCYWDQTGACVQDCIVCLPGQLPDGCYEFTRPCASPSHCPPCGPCICTMNCGGTLIPCPPPPLTTGT
jgi:hypothetical protein